MARALTTDIRQRAGLLQRLAASATRRDHDGVAQLCEGQEVAPVQWQLHDLTVLDDVADFGRRDLQQGQGALHFDLLGQPLHPEREMKGHGTAHFENDLVDLR